MQTTDKAEGTVLLTLRVHLPELLAVTPRFVSWPVGGAREPRTITLRISDPARSPVKIRSVKSSSPVLVAELKTVKEGREYAVTLTPNETDRTLGATVASWSVGVGRGAHA